MIPVYSLNNKSFIFIFIYGFFETNFSSMKNYIIRLFFPEYHCTLTLRKRNLLQMWKTNKEDIQN